MRADGLDPRQVLDEVESAARAEADGRAEQKERDREGQRGEAEGDPSVVLRARVWGGAVQTDGERADRGQQDQDCEQVLLHLGFTC